MKHLIIKSIIAAGALAFAGHQVHAETFYVALNATEVFPDAAQGNKLVRVIETNRLILEDVAADFMLDPKTLTLVFDTVADQIQVVKKIDGSIVAVEFELHGGNTVTSPNGKVQYRQAFLYKASATEPCGSAIGRIELEFDAVNPTALVSFHWAAALQHSVPMTADDEPSEIVQGVFTTGVLFVPHP